MILQYDGTGYSGWQIQENAKTIQQEIINAIKIILKEEVNLIGSGRTDDWSSCFRSGCKFQN